MNPLHCRRFVVMLLLCLCGCDSKPASDADFHHAALGWTMPIPRGWRVLPPSEVAGVVAKGKDLMEKSLGQPIEASQTDLLFLKRGALSTFTSAVQPYDTSDGVTYAQMQQEMMAAVLQAYRAANIPFRHTLGRETIGGVEFALLEVTLLERNGNKIVADQRMYDGLIGELGLTVSLTTRDLDDRDALVAAWRASRFQPADPATAAAAE